MRRRKALFTICFVGGARYSQPLDATSEKKFRALRSLGELFVIGFSQDMRPRRFTQHACFYLLPKLPLPVLRHAEMWGLGTLLTCWLIFRHGVQVLITQSPYEGFAAAWAKQIASWFGRKTVLIVESHGDFEESLFLQRRILLPWLYRFLMRFVAQFTLERADLLRAVSHSIGLQLARWVPGRPLFQFAAWTDIEAFLHPDVEEEKTMPTQDILYAGVVTPLKGVHYLINAFSCIAKDFPQSRLVIVGRKEHKAYAAELQELSQQLGLHGRVQFVGELPQIQLAALMRRGYVLVLPSTSEGLPRVIIEAMATGTPVISSHVGGISEILKDGTTGFLVQPGDETALATRLRWVLEHQDDAIGMGHRARIVAEHFFSTEMYVRNYRQVIDAAEALLAE